MKRVLRFLTLAGAVAGAVWYARQKGQPVPSEGAWEGQPSELKAVPDPAVSSESTVDDLTSIKGIGPVSNKKLADIGVTTFAELAAADPATVMARFDSRANVADWIAQAKQLES
jgi:large subunit ribosomal protein L21